uniref:Cytochrome c oxidase subunit 2 n=3 Tax=Peirates TaxID=181094 RepID=A0A0C4JZV9_PEITU|nr:cytochrome c oxidase subunit II [Peirates fulvescens]YP_009127016.1 cytochrome c oxidase subunit II [Peirates atromaculatus]YP_009127029.1 cytochrome c oxidase subunit II [Peirates turpis]AHH93120.1 cytochrome c oxidase subunit II [Peirates fulvescens]AHH93133.1 cytochrome c oxidase subunit II [Peirates atromaculatus]AHH93159.1 cytochrome c oxidase subunit II [Peirates turpis]
MATWSNLGLQDANSPIMEQLIMFHDHAMMILVMITILVAHMMITLMFNKIINRNLLEGQTIELIWTIVPAITLIFIALPSLRILYLMDEVNNPLVTIKAIGHQWYWSYEYSDFKNIEFDSYMKPTNELELEDFRLLDVDNRVILPMKTPVRILVTSSDVIHSWTIPSIGVKIDGTPGRLNQGSFTLLRPGILFGQCSEICGANHSFMPIAIESVSTECFLNWMKNY